MRTVLPKSVMILAAAAVVLAGQPAQARPPRKLPPGKAAMVQAHQRGKALVKAGRYTEAVAQYNKALALASKVSRRGDLDTGVLLNDLAVAYRLMGQYAKAEPLQLRSLSIFETKRGRTHPDVAIVLENLAALYRAMTRYAKVEPLVQRCLKIREAKLGRDHPLVARSLGHLGALYMDMARYPEAESQYARCLKIRRARLGANHPDVGTSLSDLASAYRAMGQYAKAEPLYLQGLKVWEGTLGPNHLIVATGLNNLAALYQSTGQYAKAEPLYLRSLKIREARLGPSHPDVAGSLTNLAALYESMGQYAKAEALQLRSLKIKTAKLGADHLDVANSLDHVAVLYRSRGQYTKAEPLFRRGLKIREAKLGPDHPHVATSLSNLALLYRSMGQYAKAEPLFRRSLKIREARLGPDHPDAATSLNNLAGLYQFMGQYAKAEPLFRRSLKIREARLGPDHPAVARILESLAIMRVMMSRPDDAVALFDRARRITRRHVTRVLPGLSQAEQTSFLGIHEASFHAALASAAFPGMGDPAWNKASAEWVLNGKAAASEAMAHRTRLGRHSANPATAAVARELAAVRADLARLTVSGPDENDRGDHRKRIDLLTAKELTLSKRLGQLTGQATPQDPWVTLQDVRRALPVNSVLIELARFTMNFQAKGAEKRWQEAYYAAWVIPAQGKPTVILLHRAKTIDEAVAEYRAAVRLPTAPRVGGPRAARMSLTGAGRVLAALILRPLREPLARARQVIISPDGALWLVPWGALPTDDGKFLIEDKQISYVVSGRDLAADTDKTRSSGGVVFANPDYNLGMSEALAETRRIIQGKQVATASERGGTKRSITLASLRWGPLPGTAAEARAVAPKLQSYLGTKPAMYTGKRALEGVFKTVKSPRVLLMSTHGFFLPDQDYSRMPQPTGGAWHGTFLPSKPKPPQRPSRPATIENPLLRCGLALAGANNCRMATDADDGILTGLEIVSADLRGTNLVVLSACQTGMGKVLNGEGVAGLRQAFQLAGARTVVSTLWSIPDRATAELMTAFFENIRQRRPKAAALRNAQLAMIRKLRNTPAKAHPFYWAAFTLTGQWR